MYGKASLGMKLRRLTSAGSSDSSAASRSMARSSICVASGRPAPRTAPIGVVLVTTTLMSASIFGIRYTPLDIIAVRLGRNAPRPGYAPASARMSSFSASITPSRRRAELEIQHHRAAGLQRDHALAARLGPADRAPGGASQPRDQHVLDPGALGPEPAADVGRHHPYVLLIQAEHHAQEHLVLVRRLGRDPRRDPSVLAELSGRGARFDRTGRDALRDDAALDADIARLEQPRVGLRRGHRQADVGPHLGEQEHLVLGRLDRVGHGRQRLVVDLDQLAGVHARLARVG